MTDSDSIARLKTTGRNDDCPCGSGKKYKKCHLAEDKRASNAALKAAAAAAAAKAESSTDSDAGVDAKDAGQGRPPPPRQRRRQGSKGRAADGKPDHFQRRGAV